MARPRPSAALQQLLFAGLALCAEAQNLLRQAMGQVVDEARGQAELVDVPTRTLQNPYDSGDPFAHMGGMACLKSAPHGCRVQEDPASCLSSRDGGPDVEWYGLKAHGQRCVWCGGGSCRDNAATVCEPYDFIVNGEGKAFKRFKARSTFRIAGCKNSKPAALTSKGYAVSIPGYQAPLFGPAPLVPWWVPERAPEAALGCLGYQRGGCRSITEMGACLSSRDGSGLATWRGLKVHGEPCVWCGGGVCQSNNYTLCEPFDLLMSGKGVAFGSFGAWGIFRVAGCDGGVVASGIPKPAFDYSCLSDANGGCPSLSSADACLSHSDGRPEVMKDGLKVHGEPCVWCGGIPCISGSRSLCEPFDYVVNGEGQAFTTFYPKYTFRIAACTYGKPVPHDFFGPNEEVLGTVRTYTLPPVYLEGANPAPQRLALQSPVEGQPGAGLAVVLEPGADGAGGGEGLPRGPWWLGLIVPCALLWLLLIVCYLQGMCRDGARSKTRAVALAAPASREEAIRLLCPPGAHSREQSGATGGAPEVAPPPREATTSDALFDALDRNHDGIVTASDFASAFGVPVLRPVRTVSSAPYLPLGGRALGLGPPMLGRTVCSSGLPSL